MTAAVEIIGLSKTYSDGTQAVKNISFEVKSGDFFALLGPNGAGKSTSISIITSLTRKTSGQVKIMGHDIVQELDSVKRLVGVVPQEFNFNIFESVINILYNQAGYYGISRKKAKENVEKYLKQLGLWEKRFSKSQTLSGGMKRRLMIARALVHDPKILILDEPTAGVDIEIRRSMWEFIQEINRQGTTIILTTHYLEEAEQLCRNIAIINQGEIIRNTSMREFLSELETQSLVLELKSSYDAIASSDVFKFVKRDSTTYEVDLPKCVSMNELFSHLQRQKVEVLSLRNKSNRLEELFLKLTQKRMSS
jgi:ABC-2 type transport system ATP-binding protein